MMNSLLEEVLTHSDTVVDAHENGCKCRQCKQQRHRRSCNCRKCRRKNGSRDASRSVLEEILLELNSSQLQSAAKFNHKYGPVYGWSDHYGKILDLLGLTWVHNDLAFAEAVADWQKKNRLVSDGKLGKGTWAKMQQKLGLSSSSATGNTPTPSGTDRIPASRLSWSSGDPFPRQFKMNVYNQAIANAKAAGRSFSPSLPQNQIDHVNGKPLRRDAAAAAIRLLAKAHRDSHAAGQDLQFRVASGYRSADTQFRLWNGRFAGYYQRAINENVIRRGDFSTSAVRKLARFIGRKTAAPGYSIHQNGLAIDFVVLDGRGRRLTSISTKSASIRNWKSNWFWGWLNRNALRFGFHPYTREPWHWTYRPTA